MERPRRSYSSNMKQISLKLDSNDNKQKRIFNKKLEFQLQERINVDDSDSEENISPGLKADLSQKINFNSPPKRMENPHHANYRTIGFLSEPKPHTHLKKNTKFPTQSTFHITTEEENADANKASINLIIFKSKKKIAGYMYHINVTQLQDDYQIDAYSYERNHHISGFLSKKHFKEFLVKTKNDWEQTIAKLVIKNNQMTFMGNSFIMTKNYFSSEGSNHSQQIQQITKKSSHVSDAINYLQEYEEKNKVKTLIQRINQAQQYAITENSSLKSIIKYLDVAAAKYESDIYEDIKWKNYNLNTHSGMKFENK